jgi:hypothetical protein
MYFLNMLESLKIFKKIQITNKFKSPYKTDIRAFAFSACVKYYIRVLFSCVFIIITT